MTLNVISPNLASAPAFNINKIKFAGIYADMTADNIDAYNTAAEADIGAHLLRPHQTSIFRDYPIIITVANMLKGQPADIHILGCSDGSEAYSYAIALHRLGKEASKDIAIHAIDKEQSLVELANSGYLLCTEAERERCNVNDTHPLYRDRWDLYLTESEHAPDVFNRIVSAEDETAKKIAQMTRDPVSGMSIKNGKMKWYRLNQEGFPPITFDTDDMLDYVKRPASQKLTQVYILSNSWRYLYENGRSDFLKVINGIKRTNKGKKVYIVTGQAEQLLFKAQPGLVDILRSKGMHPLELVSSGGRIVRNPRIWRLDP